MVSMRPFALLSTSLRSIVFSSRRELSLLLGGSFLASSSLQQKLFHPTTCRMASSTGYLDAESAYALDQELMSTPGFTLDQLMELAGLAVAQAVYQVAQEQTKQPKIYLICGPGNNGGDGLVAARHLTLFGYNCTVVYPKRSSREPHYTNLVKQLEDFGIAVVDQLQLPDDESSEGKVVIVDAIFGFSFKGEAREPFAAMLKDMISAQQNDRAIIASVDVPSGWNVDQGDTSGVNLMPDVLISLTAPKLSAKTFQGRHFVGGRFLPPALASKYGIQMPSYPGTSQVMEVPGEEPGWERDYHDYLVEKEAKEKADELRKIRGALEDEGWEEQYAAYLDEKARREKDNE